MVNHPNRNWRKRWSFDTTNLVAIHESGLTVKYQKSEYDESVLDGTIIGDVPTTIDWQSDPRLIPKLMRQAGSGLMEALERETKH